MKNRVESLIRTRPKSSALAQYTVPEQDELLKDEFVADIPYTKSVEEARLEPLVTLHTSRFGSPERAFEYMSYLTAK